MNVPFLDLRDMGEDLWAELEDVANRVLRSGQYVLGQEVQAFEDAFASYVGAKYCVGVGSGLDALHLGLRAMGIGPGDEVIVPANTFVATWLAVTWSGAMPVPVEPDPITYNIDSRRIEEAISRKTKLILPVHLYGQPADMAAILDIATTHDLLVLEDAAQAHGARYRGKRVGGFGTTAAWSFYPSKNLGAFGDAGAVTTDDEEIAAGIRTLRDYGRRDRYLVETIGLNSRLDALQAAMLSVKLRYLDRWNEHRAAVASRYLADLAQAEVTVPTILEGAESSWHLFVVRTKNREALQRHLISHDVETLIHYPVAPYRQQPYSGGDWPHLPVSDALHDEVLSLPIGPHLDSAQVEKVVDAVRSFDGGPR